MSDTISDLDDARRKLAADYAGLITLVRTELELALKPLRDDIRELKESSYSREVLDEKFRARDERLTRLETGMATFITRGLAVLGAIGSLVYILKSIHF